MEPSEHIIEPDEEEARTAEGASDRRISLILQFDHSWFSDFVVEAPTVSRRPFRKALLRCGLILTIFVGSASAQSDVGNTLCGTPIAEFINGVVPLVVSLAMIVGAVFAAFMHARAGVARDAEQARFYLDWRNRAGYTAVTAPLLAFLIQMLIGLTGTGVTDCINLVPFF